MSYLSDGPLSTVIALWLVFSLGTLGTTLQAVPIEKRVYTTNALPGFKKNHPALFPPGIGGRHPRRRAVIDIGANSGDDYTLKAYQKGHNVFAFEPSPIVNALFSTVMTQHNVHVSRVSIDHLTTNLTRRPFKISIPRDETPKANKVYIIPIALSNTTGVFNFHESPCSNLKKCGMINHLLPDENHSQGVRVRTYRLDDVILPVRNEDIWFMKIDVEGHELEVLQGAHGFLKDARIPYIAVEFSANMKTGTDWGVELLDNLYGLGYTCYHLRGFGKCHDAKIRSPSLSCNYPFSNTILKEAPTFLEYTKTFETTEKNKKEKPRMADLMCALRHVQ